MTPPAPRPRRRRPWWLRWTVRLGAVLVVGVALYGYLRYRIEAPLREAMTRLDREDPGWRLAEIEAAREVIPEGENSARAVTAAAALMPRGWWLDEPTGIHGRVSPDRRLPPPLYGQLCKEVDKANAALAEARRLADLPRGRHPITYRSGVAAPAIWPHQVATRSVADLLFLAALRNAEEGNPGGALTDCRAAVNAGRSLGDEPLTNSQSCRASLVASACRTAERVLAQGEPPPEALAALQRLLEEEDAFPAALVYRRAERAEWHERLLALESAPKQPEALDLRRLIERLVDGLRGSEEIDLYTRHGLMLSLMTRSIAAARLPLHEQVARDAALETEVGALSIPGMDNNSLQGHYLRDDQYRLRAGVRCMIACLACERYRQTRGRWPDAPGDLVPGQLAAVPVDPFNGRPLRYRRGPGGVAVYSVGPDGKDDDSWIRNIVRGIPGPDIGYRLWDPDKRRQPAAGE